MVVACVVVEVAMLIGMGRSCEANKVRWAWLRRVWVRVRRPVRSRRTFIQDARALFCVMAAPIPLAKLVCLCMGV